MEYPGLLGIALGHNPSARCWSKEGLLAATQYTSLIAGAEGLSNSARYRAKNNLPAAKRTIRVFSNRRMSLKRTGQGRRRWSSFQVIYKVSLAVLDFGFERGKGARGKGGGV